MAVRVYCDDPQQLLSDIKAEIRAKSIDTWQVDSDGDFTHTPPQWRFKAWFRPRVEEARLVFFILAPKSKILSKTEYGVYHGRLIEMLLTHFDLKFDRAVATALAVSGDRVGSRT